MLDTFTTTVIITIFHSIDSMNSAGHAWLVCYLQLASFSLARFLLTFPWSWIWRWLALRFLFSVKQRYKCSYFLSISNANSETVSHFIFLCLYHQDKSNMVELRLLTCHRRLSMYFFMRSLESCLASMFLVSCLSHLCSRHCAQVSLALQHERSFDQTASTFCTLLMNANTPNIL